MCGRLRASAAAGIRSAARRLVVMAAEVSAAGVIAIGEVYLWRQIQLNLLAQNQQGRW